MESRRMRSRSQILKWVCYAVALFVCAALQTTPGLLQLGQAKPLFILPLCLAVAVYEGEFAGALFGAVSGLLWDYTAGRTVGMLALELLLLCFALSVLVQVYLQGSMELCAHQHRHGPCGALAGLAVLLLHARLQLGAEPLADLCVAFGHDDAGAVADAVQSGAAHLQRIQNRQRRSLNRRRKRG